MTTNSGQNNPQMDTGLPALRRFASFLEKAYATGGVMPVINEAIPAPCLLHALGLKPGGTPELWLSPALEFMLNSGVSLKRTFSEQRMICVANDFVEMVIPETPLLGDFFFDVESSGMLSIQVAGSIQNPPTKVIQPPFFTQRRLNGPHFIPIGMASIPK